MFLTCSRPPSGLQRPAISKNNISSQSLQYEREQIQLEREKLELEKMRFNLEKEKAEFELQKQKMTKN